MNKGKAGVFAQIKRFIFVLAIVVGLLFLGGEGGGFMRIFVACCCFLFAWGAWRGAQDLGIYGSPKGRKIGSYGSI